MKYYPYGGFKNDIMLQKMSKKATESNIKKYNRHKSLEFDDVIEDLNEAFQNLSNKFNLQTLMMHLKELSIVLIVISLIGILILYVY